MGKKPQNATSIAVPGIAGSYTAMRSLVQARRLLHAVAPAEDCGSGDPARHNRPLPQTFPGARNEQIRAGDLLQQCAGEIGLRRYGGRARRIGKPGSRDPAGRLPPVPCVQEESNPPGSLRAAVRDRAQLRLIRRPRLPA